MLRESSAGRHENHDTCVMDERPVPDATRHDARHPTLESDRAHLSRRAGQPRLFASSAAA